mgnify:CR=1 FL=1
MPIRLTLVCVLAIAGAGCVNLQTITAGHIGCPESEIQIFNDSATYGTRSWSARCRGRVYHCVGITASEGAPHISCKQEPGSGNAHAAAPARGGCQYDAQCKGDRICESGRCVYPRRRNRTGGGAKSTAASARPPSTNPPPGGSLSTFEIRLGVRLGDASAYAKAMGLDRKQGAVVLSVVKEGVAFQHKIRRGDVIVSLNRKQLQSLAELKRMSRTLQSGRSYYVAVQRKTRVFSVYLRY